MILTNKCMNIHNKVAHSFYEYEDNAFEKACKIHFCVFRLGNYILTINQQN